MKTLQILLVLISSLCTAQSNFKKNIPVTHSKVSMNFTYPKIIRVSTWDKKEIEITGSIIINMGKNNDAFNLIVDDQNSALYIDSEILGYDKLPRYITINLDDKQYFFEGDNWESAEVQKFLDENKGSNVSWVSSGVQNKITLDIIVPKGIELNIQSRHGIIELNELPKSVFAYSRHQGIDATVDTTLPYNFELQTKHGDIYTNLDLEFEENMVKKYSREIFVKARIGNGGPNMVFESRHGNIYLRSKK